MSKTKIVVTVTVDHFGNGVENMHQVAMKSGAARADKDANGNMVFRLTPREFANLVLASDAVKTALEDRYGLTGVELSDDAPEPR